MDDSGLNNPFFSLSALLRILVVLKLRKEEVMEGPKRNPFLHDADKSIRDILKSCQPLVSQQKSYLFFHFDYTEDILVSRVFHRRSFGFVVMDRKFKEFKST